jgi:hypothetical protein
VAQSDAPSDPFLHWSALSCAAPKHWSVIPVQRPAHVRPADAAVRGGVRGLALTAALLLTALLLTTLAPASSVAHLDAPGSAAGSAR